MGEAFIVRKGGVVSETTASPTITIVTETDTDVTFTLTNNDDNTAFITYEIDDDIAVIELAAAATSSNITVALAAGTYTLTAYATVVGEVASQSTTAVEIVQIFEFELLFDSTGTVTFPQTSFDITGLSIGKNDELRMVYTFVQGSGSTSLYGVYPNDLTTTTQYYSQNLQGGGTTINAERANANRFTQGPAKVSGEAMIKVSNNDRFVVQSNTVYSIGSGSSSIFNTNWNIVGIQTVTSITKLSIIATQTNGVGAGSRIRLYKVNTGDA